MWENHWQVEGQGHSPFCPLSGVALPWPNSMELPLPWSTTILTTPWWSFKVRYRPNISPPPLAETNKTMLATSFFVAPLVDTEKRDRSFLGQMIVFLGAFLKFFQMPDQEPYSNSSWAHSFGSHYWQEDFSDSLSRGDCLYSLSPEHRLTFLKEYGSPLTEWLDPSSEWPHIPILQNPEPFEKTVEVETGRENYTLLAQLRRL